MILIAHSRIFQILLKSILAMILKHDLTLIISSPTQKSTKILEARKQLFQRLKYSKRLSDSKELENF
jgi:hypothetical protein